MSWGERPDAELVLEPQDSPDHALAPWFRTWRDDRAAARLSREQARARAPRRRAIITMVHNEPVVLPIWLRYYSRFFASEDIYVLDNDTTDGSTDRDGFVRIPAPHGAMDDGWRLRTFADLQRELLDRYDVVVVTDVDEIIAPMPDWGTLGEYLDVFAEEWVNCLGYELIHLRDREPPLHLDRGILEQRRHWYPNDGYDKAAVGTVPMTWRPGFHGREDFAFKPDPDLRLIHLHRMDYDICLARHRIYRQRPWVQHEVRKNWGAQNRVTEEPEFERWFYESTFGVQKLQIEEIGEAWRDLV